MNGVRHCKSCGILLPDSSEERCDQCRALTRSLLEQGGRSKAVHPSLPVPSPAGSGDEFGDYVLLKEIARGGMGRVYQARQRSLNRLVALKRPLPGMAADPERIRRFRTEAEAAAGLSHPNIIAVFESGEVAGEQFFSMAYVEGETLSEVLKRDVVPVATAVSHVVKIAHAIHHAHQRGVLHRDLKPANIIIDLAGEPQVADFGIACLLEGSRDDQVKSVAGTAQYMAPEQVHPEAGSQSVATDIYALGGILYHLLTGRPPFVGESQEEILWEVYYDEPVHPSRLNPRIGLDLEAICLKALQKRPENRYPSALAIAEDLKRFEEGRPVQARPVPPWVRCWKWIRRNPLVCLLAVSVLTAVISVMVVQRASLHSVQSARADSEGILGFMNQDLAADLRTIGRLDLMEKINRQSRSYYNAHSAFGDSGYLERKAAFLENAATVSRDLGDLSTADRYAAEAEEICWNAGRNSEAGSQWDLRESRLRLARYEIAHRAGRRKEAHDHIETAVGLAERATTGPGSNPTNNAHLARALIERAAFGIGGQQTHEPAMDLLRAEKLLATATSDVRSDPEWSLWLANISYYRGRIAQIQNDRGLTLEAYTNYLLAVENLVSRNPRNRRWLFELAVANSQVAVALQGLKQTAEARAYFDRWEELSRQLTEQDPRNKQWAALHAKSLAWQGLSLRGSAPDRTRALQYLGSAMLIQSNLVFQSPEWEQVAQDAAETYAALIEIHNVAGEDGEATLHSEAFRHFCEACVASSPERSGHQMRLGDAMVSHARQLAGKEGRGARVARLQQMLATFDEVAPTNAAVLAKARILSALALVFSRDGRPLDAARTLNEALELRLGYFDQSPLIAKLRDQIPNNCWWVTQYYVNARENERAVAVATTGLDWAAANLAAEENRQDFAELGAALSQIQARNPQERAAVRNAISRCVAERLTAPPLLLEREQTTAAMLRDWLAQHP